MNTLYVAWRGLGDAGEWGPVGRLDYDGEVYRFFYTQGARNLPGFRPFEQLDDLDSVYEAEELFPLFKNRVLSKSRPEYEQFLRWGGFDPLSPPDPIAILGVTEGLRATDSVEVFPCPQPAAGDGCYINKFFLHGVRWLPAAALERVNKLDEGEVLYVMLDLCNDHDRFAVAVRTDRERMLIGYVPRYLSADISRLLKGCDPSNVSLEVERLNRDAPLQQRVLCKMRSCWPEGFKPYSGEEFTPIAPQSKGQGISNWLTAVMRSRPSP